MKTIFLAKLQGNEAFKKVCRQACYKENDPTQTQISFSDLTLGTFVFNNENARKEIAKFIIQNEQPFYLAKNPMFIRMLPCGFNPNFKSVLRNT